MNEQFSRSAMLLGDEAMEKIVHSRVALFGLGGVGGYVLEALVRGGVGSLDLVDKDTVSVSNLNRQILATHETVGMEKTQAAYLRAKAIHPEVNIRLYPMFYTAETAGEFDFSQYDYIVDAIDTVSAKISLAVEAAKAGTPIISCMGTGNKLNPAALQVADLSKTSVCPLARVMRRELGKRGIRHMKVVYSQEEPRKPEGWEEEAAALGKRQIPGSTPFVPGAAGLILASEVLKDLAGIDAQA